MGSVDINRKCIIVHLQMTWHLGARQIVGIQYLLNFQVKDYVNLKRKKNFRICTNQTYRQAKWIIYAVSNTVNLEKQF